jgi:hypothetical protein
MDTFLKYIGAISATLAALFAARKFYYWMLPVRIGPSLKIVYEESNKDEIGASIVNRSNESIYITECFARGTYSFKYIVMRHFKHPLMPLRLYQNVRFSAVRYKLLNGENLKLEPNQQVNLKCVLSEHPLNSMYTPYFLVEVKLSSGRIIRSRKLRAPARWNYLNKMKPNKINPTDRLCSG